MYKCEQNATKRNGNRFDNLSACMCESKVAKKMAADRYIRFVCSDEESN